MTKVYQCQVNGRLSLQACGEKAGDGGYSRCEIIGPHERHQVGRHTIEHALAGNGYACEAIERQANE